MKALRYIFGILATICLIVALLLGSVQLDIFGLRGFWEKTFAEEKSYETVGMSLEDETALCDYMLDYLQGKYDDLSYITTMWGEQRDFFDQREKEHMVDVKNLNLGSVTVMRISLELFVLFFLIVLAICFKTSARDYARNMILKTMAVSFIAGTAVFIAVLGIGAFIVAQDFGAFWVEFHHVFFTGNDLWLLDPNVDMLINVTTETLFAKLVLRIAITFVTCLVVLIVGSIVYLVAAKKKNWIIKLGVIVLVTARVLFPAEESYAEDITSLSDAPAIQADNAILIDAETGQVLYAKNEKASAYPASTTKIMTALLALENLKLTDKVTFSKSAIYALTTGASHIGMTVGEELTVEQCLYGLLLPSANEVANALAERVSGSMDDFVTQMNARAASLGCVNTSFANPNGLHSEEHTTCAYDLALIFKKCIETPGFLTIDSEVTYVIPKTNLIEESRPMRTTHNMMKKDSEYYDERVVCGKTGHTDEALGCLVTYAKSGSNSLICVVLHSLQPAQYTDTKALLDYGFERFAHVSGDVLSEYLFATDEEMYPYAGKDEVAIYMLDTEDLMLLPADLNELKWEIDGGRAKLSSGTLEFGSIPFSVSHIEENIYDSNGLLPIEKNPVFQIEKKNDYTLVYVLVVISVILLIALVIIILRSRFVVNIRKRHTTHIVRNPGTKTIKLK